MPLKTSARKKPSRATQRDLDTKIQFIEGALALEKAIQLGYSDFKWLAKDPDLKKFRAQPAYAEIKEKIRRMKNKAR
jgi:hypothetical protein